ncbi:hypothetical protein GCM10007301_55890 [Azorhizobium oxalatiphilum]|uniref:Protein translocase subunit SecE n=2 Tax=Azorhizobium oxalatiphilum TaxID=980631 RepID=A0A917CHP8_9HYPH|nr:hypothetical protein GCM10007301_55890 [Azorhizobium oxalatiphilum]
MADWRTMRSGGRRKIRKVAVARAPSGCRASSRSDMAKISPVEFFQQVRAETAKVTWPSRRETAITTAMVFVMVLVASIFFMIIDQILRFGVSQLLSLGH